MLQRRVPTVQTVQEAQKFHSTGAVLGSCRYACRCATTGAGVQPVQAALELQRAGSRGGGSGERKAVCSWSRSSSHR